MRKVTKTIALATLFFVPFAYAEFYKVEVTRVEGNLYKTREGIYIETKYCYEYANRDEAILSYERNSHDNKLIFSNGQSCDVARVLG